MSNKQKTLHGAILPAYLEPGRTAKQCPACSMWFSLPNCHAARHTSCSAECLLSARRKTKMARARYCLVCSAEFIPRPAQIANGGAKYCTLACFNTISGSVLQTPEYKAKARAAWMATVPQILRERIGPKNKQWRGGRFKENGYWVLRKPGTKDGEIKFEHRDVMEDHLGRKLSSEEIVHHINHNKTDNRIDNLVVLTRSEHMREHKEEITNARKAVKISKGNKITIDIASGIKSDLRAGITRSEIAIRYGLTPAMVGYIANGKSWVHAP